MARKQRAVRRTSSTVKRKKKRTQQHVSRAPQNRALIAILALLFLLHLIDEKTFDSVASTMKPPKKAKKRRGRGQRRVVHEKKKTRLSRRSWYTKSRRWALMSSTLCRCGSGKRPLGYCNECGMNYCSECQFTHLYQPLPMKTSDSIAANLENAK